MTELKLRIGSRKSELALKQTYIIEDLLIKHNYAKTAKEYITYRHERTSVREAKSRLMSTLEHITFQDSKESDVKRENANIDGDTAMGTMLKYGSESAKDYYLTHLLPKDIADAHINGDIHIHDLDFYTLTLTCCQIDVLKLFHGGFSTGHGFLREPNDIRSYAALACIAIQADQNDMHGGQAIPNFDFAMAEGVKKTYNKIFRNNIIKFIDFIDGKNLESELKPYFKELYKSEIEPRYHDYDSQNKVFGLLEEKYPETDEMNDELKQQAESYYSAYEQYYKMDKETFLSNNGFGSEKAFLEYLRLQYRRNKYAEDYIKTLISDKEVEKYYEDKVYGDINTKHILVKVDSSASDEDKKKAEDLAKEIISKLNNGKSFDDVKEEYKDQITYEELGYKSYNANLESAYMEAMQKLENNSYSKEPVKTSYGYHVIYRIDQKEKPVLEDVKEEIIDSLVSEKKSEDKNISYVALDKMREESGLKFSDTVLEKKYNTYMSQYK